MVVYKIPLEKIRTRYVKKSKYERNNSETRRLWMTQFEVLENYIKTPHYKRKESLVPLFSDQEINNFAEYGLELFDTKDLKKLFFSLTREKSFLISPPTNIESNGTYKRKSETSESSGTINCYATKIRLNNFLNKPFDEARAWNPKIHRFTISDINYVPLILKAQLLEERKAQDFDDYIKSIQSFTESEIDKDTILDIFEMIHSKNIHESLQISVKEVSTIPNDTGRYLKREKYCLRSRLYRELNRDLLAAKLEAKYVAFGRTLQTGLRRGSFKETITEKIFKNAKIYDDIETFAAVWRGITDLETTNKFCEFLYHHREVPAPTYLQEVGLLNFHEMRKKLGPVNMFGKKIKIVKPSVDKKKARSIADRSDISDEHIVL